MTIIKQNKELCIRKYKIHKQTEYNIAKVAAMGNVGEGRALDKIVREYMLLHGGANHGREKER